MIFENGSIWIPPKKEKKMENIIGLCYGCSSLKKIIYRESPEAPTGLCEMCLAKNLSKNNDPKIVALAEWTIEKLSMLRINDLV